MSDTLALTTTSGSKTLPAMAAVFSAIALGRIRISRHMREPRYLAHIRPVLDQLQEAVGGETEFTEFTAELLDDLCGMQQELRS